METFSEIASPSGWDSIVGNIRILHECQGWIDKSVLMPNYDPRGRFVYPYLTSMMYSFSCTP